MPNPLPFKPKKTHHAKAYLTAKDLMWILDLSEGTAYRLMHDMPHIRIGKVIRVSKDALEAYLDAAEKRG